MGEEAGILASANFVKLVLAVSSFQVSWKVRKKNCETKLLGLKGNSGHEREREMGGKEEREKETEGGSVHFL